MNDDDRYGPATYGDRIASIYDKLYAETPYTGDVAPMVAFLTSLAGAGPALELGIGTGRVALPLAATGSRSTGSTLRKPW